MGRKVMRSYIISTISIALVLFMVGVVSSVSLSAISAARKLRESVVVSVEIRDDISADSRRALEMMFEDRTVCAGAQFLSKDVKIADEAFRSQFAVDLDLLLGENPLLDSYEVALHADYSNREGMTVASAMLERDFGGLCFINLVDFDMNYGHRQDADGYAVAMSEFDAWLGDVLPKLKADDALIITADHGCDPSDDSTDHTRENVPMLIYGNGIEANDLGVIEGFDNIGKAVYELITKG